MLQKKVWIPTCTSNPNEANSKSVSTDTFNTIEKKNTSRLHVSQSPKLFIIPSEHKPRAKVVQEIHSKLDKAYFRPKLSLKCLNFHDASGYQVRSERREVAIAILQAMNHYQDDATGKIGRLKDDGSFGFISVKKLAKYAQVNIRRAKRAISDIVRAGYLKVSRQFSRCQETGQVKGFPSYREFLPKFFSDLHVDLWMKVFSQRQWSKERSSKKLTTQDRKRSRAMMGMIKSVASTTKKFQSVVNKACYVSSQDAEAKKENERMLTGKALELFKLDQSKSIIEHYKDLKESNPFK